MWLSQLLYHNVVLPICPSGPSFHPRTSLHPRIDCRQQNDSFGQQSWTAKRFANNNRLPLAYTVVYANAAQDAPKTRTIPTFQKMGLLSKEIILLSKEIFLLNKEISLLSKEILFFSGYQSIPGLCDIAFWLYLSFESPVCISLITSPSRVALGIILSAGNIKLGCFSSRHVSVCINRYASPNARCRSWFFWRVMVLA